MDLVGKKTANTRSERIHRNAGRPQDEIAWNAMLLGFTFGILYGIENMGRCDASDAVLMGQIRNPACEIGLTVQK